jgi:predicted regulator of Ras-like GTPase activity (Roadblock/LC7/MglB family)
MGQSFILPKAQAEQIQTILDELLMRVRATYVFVADISGQLIMARGRAGSTNISELAALTASNMAATTEIARRIGESQGFRLLFHEGERENIYLSHVGVSFLLAVVFGCQVQIGLVRLLSKRAVDDLSALIAEYEDVVKSVPSVMEAEFTAALEQELDHRLPT